MCLRKDCSRYCSEFSVLDGGSVRGVLAMSVRIEQIRLVLPVPL